MADIGVGLVGYGLAGKVFHGMLVKATPGLRVVAIVTSNPDRRRQAEADFPGVQVYESYDDLLADANVQLVVLGTPHDTHADMTIQACERGKHVVVDKIMALSVAEADAMIAAAERNGVLLSVFHNRRWDSDFLTVKKALADGLIGEPYVIESSVVRFGRPPANRDRLPWRLHAMHGGGPFRDWGAHLMDQAVQLFGTNLESVYGDFQYRWPGIDVESAAFCEMRFASGVRYRVEVGNISKIGRPRWYVRGSEGSLTIEGLDPQENALKEGVVVAKTERAKMPRSACKLVTDVPGAQLEIIAGDYAAYYQNVAAALRGHEPLAVTAAGVRDVLRVMEAVIESARTKQTVRMG